jgi:hypothetical protein
MAITVLAIQTMSRDGLEPTFSAANADGHTFANNGRTFIQAFNDAAVDIEHTFATPGQVDGLDIEDLVVDIPAGEDRIIGPFPPSIYNTEPGVTDVVTLTFESVTTLTIAAINMPVN